MAKKNTKQSKKEAVKEEIVKNVVKEEIIQIPKQIEKKIETIKKEEKVADEITYPYVDLRKKAEPIQQPEPNFTVDIPFYEQIANMINNEKGDFDLIHNGVVIYSNKLSHIKPTFTFTDKYISLYGKFYDYRGLQFIKK